MHYNPENPAESVLDNSAFGLLVGLIICCLIYALGAVGGVVVLARRFMGIA